MKNNAIIIAWVALFIFWIIGCAGRPDESPLRRPFELVQPVPRRSEELEPFPFGGLHRITKFERYGAAEDLANPAIADGFTFTDGGFTITLMPVPYGVRLSVANNLFESVVLDGSRCTLIDVKGASHSIELRPPTMLYPPREPWSQTMAIAPRTSSEICFDAISAVNRSEINESARSERERGAFVVIETKLPIFCSGYFLYPSDKPDVERVRRWAFGRDFAVYLELRGADGIYYGYRLTFTPFRFATGPDSAGWEDKKPTPVAGEP